MESLSVTVCAKGAFSRKDIRLLLSLEVFKNELNEVLQKLFIEEFYLQAANKLFPFAHFTYLRFLRFGDIEVKLEERGPKNL